MHKLQLLITTYYLQIYELEIEMIWIWDLHWGSILVNEVGQWFYQLDHVTFYKNVFWSVNFSLFFYQLCYIQMSTL